jgi:hypothetical protein
VIVTIFLDFFRLRKLLKEHIQGVIIDFDILISTPGSILILQQLSLKDVNDFVRVVLKL